MLEKEKEMTDFTKELLFGMRPVRRTNPQPGESEWYYLDPRGADTFDSMKHIDVASETSPNPYAGAIQNYLYKNDPYNYKQLYGNTPPPAEPVQTQVPISNVFTDTFGGYETIDNSMTKYQAAPKRNTANIIPAPRISTGEILLEGVKGFGEGILGATEYTISSLTNGGYDLLNDVYFDNGYEQRQNNLEQTVQQTNLGKPLKYMKYYLDAVSDSVPIGLGIRRLPKLMSKGYNKFRKIL